MQQENETELIQQSAFLGFRLYQKTKVDGEMKVLGLCFLRFCHVLVPVDKATDQYVSKDDIINTCERIEDLGIIPVLEECQFLIQ